jgi:hypothetical protein
VKATLRESSHGPLMRLDVRSDSLAEGSEFELTVPVSKLSDDDIIPGGAAEDTGRHAGYFIWQLPKRVRFCLL